MISFHKEQNPPDQLRDIHRGGDIVVHALMPVFIFRGKVVVLGEDIGVNTADADESLAVCQALDAAFGFGVKEGNSSNFAGSGVEVMKSPYLGKNGHIAVKTNSIPRAAAELAKNGFTLDESTAKYKGEKMVAVYLKQEFGGFAVHLLQK